MVSNITRARTGELPVRTVSGALNVNYVVCSLCYVFLLEEQKKERNNASEKNRRKRERKQNHFLFNTHKQSLLQESDKETKEGKPKT